MATVRRARTSLILMFWFFLSVVRAWPARFLGHRPTGVPKEAIVLRFPSLHRDAGYALEVSFRPSGARIVRTSNLPLIASLSPGALITPMPRMLQACTATPSPPPPVTTVSETTHVATRGCTRTTINTVCNRTRPLPTEYCRVRACCWSGDQPLDCTFVSSYTVQVSTSTTYHTCRYYSTCYD